MKPLENGRLLKEHYAVGSYIEFNYKIYTTSGNLINLEAETINKMIESCEKSNADLIIEDKCICDKTLRVVMDAKRRICDIAAYIKDCDAHIDTSLSFDDLYTYRDLNLYEQNARRKIQEVEYKPFKRTYSKGALPC